MLRHPWLLMLPLAMAAEDAAFTIPPPWTPSDGTLQVRMVGEAIRDEPNLLHRQPRTLVEGLTVGLGYSPSDRVVLDVQWTTWVMQIDDPTFATSGDFGDLALGTTLRVHPGRGLTPTVALHTTVTLPETSPEKGLGPDTIRFEALVILGWRESWFALRGETGFAIYPISSYTGAESGQNDLIPWGGGFELGPWNSLTVLGEAAGLAGRNAQGADDRAEARFGLRCSGNRLALDLVARRRLTDVDQSHDGWGGLAGLTWTIPP